MIPFYVEGEVIIKRVREDGTQLSEDCIVVRNVLK
jgi:hypothetical protein